MEDIDPSKQESLKSLGLLFASRHCYSYGSLVSWSIAAPDSGKFPKLVDAIAILSGHNLKSEAARASASEMISGMIKTLSPVTACFILHLLYI